MIGQMGRIVSTVVLVAISFAVTSLILWVSGYDVAEVLSGTVQGALTASGAFISTIRWAIPLFLIALGVMVAFRAGFFNIGGQGQFYVGACAALATALGWRTGPSLLVIIVSAAAAVGAGALWSLIPGWLRVRFGTDEVLTTLMMSFIGTLVLQYLTGGPLRNPAGTGATASTERIPDAFRLTGSSGVSWRLLAVVAVTAVVIWALMERTRFGLSVELAGRNPLMARWQGVNVSRVGLAAFAVSGGLAGLAGAMEVFGPAGRLITGFSPTVGFDAIVVVMVGLLSVSGMALSAVFFGGLQAAILFLPIVTDVPPAALVVLNGMVALLVTARFRSRRRRPAADPVGPETDGEVAAGEAEG